VQQGARSPGFGSLGAMFSQQPEIPLSDQAQYLQNQLARSSTARAASMVAGAGQQFWAPMAPPTSEHAFGVRGDGTVGQVAVRTNGFGALGDDTASAIPVGHSIITNTSIAAPQIDYTLQHQSAGVDSSAPLESDVNAAQDGAQTPSVVTMASPDQVPGSSLAMPGTHPAATTGGHWLGGLAVAAAMVGLAIGGVALFRAVQ
jgi:hypothetical protein